MTMKYKKYPFLEKYSDLFDEKKDKQLYRYYELIHEYNKVMNLTGIDKEDEVYLKHFFDSLTVTDYLDDVKKKDIADLGTGAGFPGIVLAIVYPETTFHLIEPLQKRCRFLKIVVEDLELENVIIVNKRAEEIDTKFDVLVSRAVARLNILLELSIPLIKTGGYFIAMKGSQADIEISEAKNALKKLSCEVIEKEEFKLPKEESMRMNIKIKKTKETSKKYPRNFGQIKKKPL